MHVVHANWSDGALCLWAESGRALIEHAPAPAGAHPFAASGDELNGILGAIGRRVTLRLALPAAGGRPLPSPRLAHSVGHGAIEEDEATVAEFAVEAAALEANEVADALDALLEPDENGRALGRSVAYYALVSRLAWHVLAEQRFVPMLVQDRAGGLGARWMPWLSDEQTERRVEAVVRAMPASARAAVDAHGHRPWSIVCEMVGTLVDAWCRRTLTDERMGEAIEDLDAGRDAHVALVSGLLSERSRIEPAAALRPEMVRGVRRWIGGLEERGVSADWRLALRLNEPLDAGMLEDLAAPPDSMPWSLSFHLQPVESPQVLLDAADIWALAGDAVTVEGVRAEGPQELLLAELGRASRIYKALERALGESEPIELELTTTEAYRFLRDVRPLLMEQGFGVAAPDWWESPSARLGARLQVDSEPVEDWGESGRASATSPQLGLDTLVSYRWEIAVGDVTLSLHEFEQLAERKAPLVRVGGRWVEIRPEDVRAAIGFIRENPGGTMRVGEALRLAYSTDARQTGVPVLGMDVSGWIGALLGHDEENRHLPLLEAPGAFVGTLRPYQRVGLSWLAFMERFGFGLCLADDMGLGKTIQLLALLAWERQGVGEIGPTLLIAPMSVVGNWLHEARRFCPDLRVVVHHGADRLNAEGLTRAAGESDMVVTTYALANRDREALGAIGWRRVVLDEAQYIKNPQAKQTAAVRSLHAERRVALTGTPVENRLSELWSIMEFLNPGYLGSPATFRKRFSVPIERYRDQHRSEQLRGLVRPFVLRRLKTDPDVASDLPEKVETKEYCHLTGEQAELYEKCVSRMLGDVDRAEGIHRRGLVLATLIKLKQICNHPAQALKDHNFELSAAPAPGRSGKAIRLIEMLEEVLAEGHQALVFTQFRQMGRLLVPMLRHALDREILFLHGGTTKTQREQMIERFQKADGSAPVLILSLKAGGVGLNLTAASHVVHYDRWWNPAVEDQATDRAYRIGQTKAVQVHKFVVSGTLEERIDEMIERKTELARNIIGAGERWLTELDTRQLREVLELRRDAVGDD